MMKSFTMNWGKFNWFGFFLLAFMLVSMHGTSQSFTFTAGSATYTENFDGMGATGTTFPTGWSAYRYAGTGTIGAALTLAVTDGSANSGGVYNTGSTSATDRSLGCLASGSTMPRFGTSFVNNTGATITSAAFSFLMEQWRSGSSNTVNEIIAFEYSLDATSLSTGTWTAYTPLDLNEKLTTTTTAAAVNGNDAANQTAVSSALALTWVAGGTLWIRWTDTDNTGSDGIYTIDNLLITATYSATTDPEPSNHVSSFTTGTITHQSIVLNWTGSVGSQLPSGYLLLGKKASGTFASVADGTAVANDVDWANDNFAINLAHAVGANTYTLNGLTDNTQYDFKIYAYTNSGASIDFKTDGTIPSVSGTTLVAPFIIESEDFATCPSEDWIIVNQDGDNKLWACSSNSMLANGFGATPAGSVSNDWLISPAINLDNFTNEVLTFQTKTQYTGPALKCKYSTNYSGSGDPGAATWTELTFTAATTTTFVSSGDVDLSAIDGSSVYIGFHYTSTGTLSGEAANWWVDNILITGFENINTNDQDSKAEAPVAQLAAFDISSTVDTEGEAVEVFKFKIHDLGTADAEPTVVTNVKIVPGASNTASWSSHIAGVKLFKGEVVSTGTPVISDSEILFPVSPGNLNIASGASDELVLKIYLKTTVSDGAQFQFSIPATGHGFTAANSGSGFASNFNTAINSNIVGVEVTATKLAIQTPSDFTPNNNFIVTVRAKDDNNNTDVDQSVSVTLSASGSGSLSSATGLVQNLSSGIYVWNDVRYSAEEPITITATAIGFDVVQSGVINPAGNIPAGYYDAAAGKTGAELKTALYNIIKGHTVISYDGLWTAYQTTDMRSDGKVWDMYSNCTFTFITDQCGNYSEECDCYNREHSMPKSWFNDVSPMNSDAFMVVPTDGYVNGIRGNYAFGEVGTADYTSGNGCKRGNNIYPGYTGTVFEPAAEFKGDFARIYFYMATRYENLIAGWENYDNDGDAMMDGTAFPCFEPWALNMLMEWSSEDPVSQKEIDRNNAVYALQNNRNPFVDHPEWVSSIWSSTSCVPPVTQASAFASSNITQTQATISWTRGNGNSVLVLAYQGGPVNSDPVDGASYSANSVFGSGNVIGTGNYVVYNGTGTSVTVTGLNFGTSYHFAVYEYNTDGNCYNASQLTGNITTLPKDEPSEHVSSFAVAETTANSITLSWVDPSSGVIPDYYLVRWSSLGFANIPVPVDGTAIANNDSVLNIAIGVQGTTFIGLEAEKTYYFKIFPYSNTGINIDFKTDGSVPQISATTDVAPSGGMETFDNLTAAGSYVTGTFAGQDGSTWNYVKCRGDVAISGKAIMLGKNQSPASEFYSGTLSGGISNISFDYKKAYTTDANFQLLINNEVIQVFTSADEGVVKNSGNIAVNVSGDFVIKFNQVNTSSGQVVIDNISWVGFADVTPPAATFNPADGTINVAIDDSVFITFNEAIRKADGSELTDSDVAGIVQFKKINASGEAIAFTGTISVDKKTITLVPNANLLKSTVYYVAIEANTIEDKLGNEMAAQSASFTTIHPIISITAPTENQIFNQGDEMSITWTSQFVDSVNVRIYIQSELLHNSNVLASLGSFLYPISSTATHSGLYSVKMYDKLDASIGDTVVFRVSDVTSPQISALLPLNGAINQTLAGNLVLTSSESLQKGTGNIEIYTSADVLALQIDVQTTSLNGLELTIPYSGLSGETSYYVKIGSGVLVDQGGNSLIISEKTTWTFSTHETVAPVLTFNPADGQTNILINSLITITFSEPVRKINNDAVTNSDLAAFLSLKLNNASGTNVPFNATINAGKTIITIDPVENLLGEQLYYLAITADLEDAFNNAILAQAISFTTADANMPYVNISPADGSLHVDVTTNVLFTFNEPIRKLDDSEITDSDLPALVNFKLFNALGANVPFTATINAEKTEISLNPDADLASETVYYAAFLAGAEDFQQNPVSPVNVTFTTRDIIAPGITFSPINGAVNVAEDANIILTFSEPVRKADNNELTNQDLFSYLIFNKTDVNGDAVLYTATINAEKTVISIDPTAVFESEQVYFVALISGIEDAWDNAVAPQSISFTSEDNISPTAEFIPANGATNVDDQGNLFIQLSEAIRKADDTELLNADLGQYIRLKKTNSTGVDVSFEASVNPGKNLITINPVAALESEQLYYFAIESGLEDKNNNALNPSSIYFTSEDNLAPMVSFVPENGSSLVLVGQNLSLIFTEQIYKSGGLAIQPVDVNTMVDLKKTDANGENVAFVVSVTDTSFVLTPVETLLYNQLYYIALKPNMVYDFAGNVCPPASASFTTQLEPVNNHETFANLTSGSSYVSGTFVGQDGSMWSYTSARGDQTIEGKAICFQNSGNPYLLSGTLHYGIKKLWFKHQQKFTGTGGKITSVLINGINILSADIPVTTVLDTFEMDNVNITGDFTLKIITNGSTRIAIDDIEWTSLVPVTLIQVNGLAGATSIETDDGTLQMMASVYPTNASNKAVAWSVENLTGTASISETGLLTALTNGTVRVMASALDGSGISGTIEITITNQILPVTSVELISSTGLNQISVDDGSLQINAIVLPVNATNPVLDWSVINLTGIANIDQNGLLTAVANGTVTVVAVSTDGTNLSDSLEIAITNQLVLVESIVVTTEGGLSAIDSDNGTLQMFAEVGPIFANNKVVIWTVENQTGMAEISSSGLLTALTNGTVLVKATATDGSGIFGTKQIAISNQVVPVVSIVVTSQGGVNAINVDDGTLQMLADVSPSYADNTAYTWSVENQTGMATINASGLLTAIKNGTVLVKATANDGSGIVGSLLVTLSNQVVLVASVTLSSASGFNVIDVDDGTLQIIANILPAYATNKTLLWSVINGTGIATVNQTGLVKAVAGGNVTVKASSTDGSNVYGTLELVLLNQIDNYLVNEIVIQSAGNVNTISVDDGTLQLEALVSPAEASDKSVTWAIENGSGMATISSDGLVTAITNGNVTVSATANDGSGVSDSFEISISNQVVPVETVSVGSISDQINVDNGTLQMEAVVLPLYADDISVTWSVENQTGVASIGADGLLTAIANGNVVVKATSNYNSDIFGTKAISLNNQIVLVESIVVSSETMIDEITIDNGTLQMEAVVEPSYATNNEVVWSVENQTGMATISQSGVLTAIKNGSVLVKATAIDSTAVFGSLQITISNQIIPVETITVSSLSGSDSIANDDGTLQMQAIVLPAYADDLSFVWSVENQTGMAIINQSGLLTAVLNGNVLVKATANDGSGVFGTMLVTLSNQVVPVESIVVNGFNNVTEITEDNGTLQMLAIVNPSYATNPAIVWSVENQTGMANISAAGLLTAINNGTVLVKASSTDGSGVFGSLQINLLNQVVPVETIVVSSVSGSTAITVDNGTLQMQAAVNPTYATNPAIVWSVENQTGIASVDQSGLLTAIANGYVLVKAAASDGTSVFGSLQIAITNQVVPVENIIVSTSGSVTEIAVDNGTLQLIASVSPVYASNTAVVWSVENQTGIATISVTGLLTAVKNGTVLVKATASDGNGAVGSLQITLSNQIVPVSSVSVSSQTGLYVIDTDNGTLQMLAEVLPNYASQLSVNWSVEEISGQASISSTGLLTAIENGIVEVVAIATDGSGVSGTRSISITNQVPPDTQAPGFVSPYPQVVSISQTGANVEFKLDEPGEIFWMLRTSNLAPGIEELLQTSPVAVSQANTVVVSALTNLMPVSNYYLFIIARDDETIPNVQASITMLSFVTTGYQPSIATQPQGLSLCPGSNATFAVEATGSAPISFEWYFNNQEIENENQNTLLISNISSSDAGNYYCKVFNAFGQVFTDTVSLTVKNQVEIVVQPVSANLCLGGSFEISVEALGNSIVYQWFKNQTEIENANSSVYSIESVSGDDEASYKCRLSGECTSELFSSAADLMVSIPAFAGDDIILSVYDTLNLLDLNTLLSSQATPGGNWYNADFAFIEDGIISPEAMGEGNYVFMYKVTNAPCLPDTAFVQLTVLHYTGIASNEVSSISIYPNPAGEWFIVSISDGMSGKIVLTDLHGKVLISENTDGSGSLKISLENIPQGVYVVSVTSQKKRIVTSLIRR